MSISFVIILAIIQGLTEFLPISSSGHLVLAPRLLHAADQGIIMDVALHVGTLLAILVYYRRDVFGMAASVLFWRDPARAFERKLAIFIVLATIPAVIAGVLIHHFFPDGIRAIAVIATTTLVFGVLMGLADRLMPRDKTLNDITLRSALLIGLAQTLALIPGTSRSGITMTMARVLGFARVDAARFSFLLGIPAIAGAGVLGLLELMKSGSSELMFDAALGMACSFIAGLAAIHFMIRWLSRYGLLPFAIYRIVLACVLFAYIVYQV